jgi:hypothetical protein
MLLIRQNPAAWEALSEADKNQVMAEVDVLMKELSERGEWVGGEGLMPPARAKTVRVRDGVTTVTDGPYAEAKEQLAGFLTVDVADEARAIEIAARWPDARWWSMEVREVIEAPSE